MFGYVTGQVEESKIQELANLTLVRLSLQLLIPFPSLCSCWRVPWGPGKLGTTLNHTPELPVSSCVLRWVELVLHRVEGKIFELKLS